MISNVVKKTVRYGDFDLTLETGQIARQATAAVIASMGETVVLATVVAQKEPNPAQSGFFPLTVHYQERIYAAGRVPGGYFKREGRPSETEILISRLIDRALRPLFLDGFENEVQIIVTVLSLDNAVNPDIPALIAASAAVSISGIPFNGPVAAARVGFNEGICLLNPTLKQMQKSELDLVVAGTEDAVLMVESEAKELSEKTMLGAVLFGHTEMQTVIKCIKELAQEAGKPAWNWQPPVRDQDFDNKIMELFGNAIAQAYQIHDKLMRQTRLAEIRNEAITQLNCDQEGQPTSAQVKEAIGYFEKKIVRKQVISGNLRIDGRDHKTVRSISIKPGILPRTHGSVLFTRGETQAIVVATLGTNRDAQIIDALEGERKESFMLHYNFPPYSVGETGQVGSPKRREIGHGRLAKRAIQPVLPKEGEFPYVLRVVSEITESNGSSSMATVCGTSLALMDAGVPIKAPVAGVAMGLIKEGEHFAVLTDILGDEDHLGDMDFKVAGTNQGVTALQMDIKINGITKEIMEVALEQAKEGRLHILEIMNGVLPHAREKMSQYAPRIVTMKIDQDKIRDVIGKGGATIRSITEETGAVIDISEDGTVTIAAVSATSSDSAMERIQAITTDIEVGGIYQGKVTRLADFGAFVSIAPGKEGLLHISQIANERIEKVSDKLREGDMVRVKVLEIDRQGRIRLSAKVLLGQTQESTSSEQNQISQPQEQQQSSDEKAE